MPLILAHNVLFVQVNVVTLERSTSCAADLDEWYRVAPGSPLRHQFLGRWSRPGQFVITNEDFWQRRRDLEGLQLNVATVEVSVLTGSTAMVVR